MVSAELPSIISYSVTYLAVLAGEGGAGGSKMCATNDVAQRILGDAVAHWSPAARLRRTLAFTAGYRAKIAERIQLLGGDIQARLDLAVDDAA